MKGCYERNFAVFKNIFAFEEFIAHFPSSNGAGDNNIDADAAESDRLREYERRIYTARKSGFNTGSLSSRLLDHWHRAGWYNVFHSRYVSFLVRV